MFEEMTWLNENSNVDRAEYQRLVNRLTYETAKQRHLTETLGAIEASSAWAIATRLSHWRRRWLPDGSRRLRWFQRAKRGVNGWKEKGLRYVAQRVKQIIQNRISKFISSTKKNETNILTSSITTPLKSSITASFNSKCIRVAYVGISHACDAQSMRYRAYNIIEALESVGASATFVPQEEVPNQLSNILSHDLIVLVRVPYNQFTRIVIESARQLSRPVVYDIDDYLFDPWVMPYVEAFRIITQLEAINILHVYSECLSACDYFTGSTSYLAEQAENHGKISFVIPNGINATQIELSKHAIAVRDALSRRDLIRLGYFSGTRTHQTDFRVIYPSLMFVLRQHRNVRLTIRGELDLGEFPGLIPLSDQIEKMPLCKWTELPEAMASVDINLIPLEATPFNEGKSNLKYFEAGLVKVPSVASPTRVNIENIHHGHNGLLASSPQEWSDSLVHLIKCPSSRSRMGQNACEHVEKNFFPKVTAEKAMDAYRYIIDYHRSRRAA